MVNRFSNRVRQMFSVLLLMLFSLWLTPASAALTASVDRTTLAKYETLELTLRTDSDANGAPDLSPLEKDFDILGTRQSRQVRMINGNTESWRDWIITLSPKRQGPLIIPSLTLEGDSSQLIAVAVTDRAATSTDNVSPVFIKTSVDNETAYVQEEVILTLQIYYRVQLYDDRRLTPLNIDGAIVQQLGDTSNYETIVNGTRYGVFELKFSIHPQKTGIIEIPSVTFSGSIAERRDPFGSMFSGGGKPVIARSAEISLNVQPQPKSYTGSVWLPARKLTISDGWSGSTDDLKVGDAITRTIAINAEGLTSAQLPAVKVPRLSGINTYPDKSTSDDKATPEGIRGSRIEATAIIPTRPGILKLPPIRYTWFDTISNSEQVAEIPDKILRILPADKTEPVVASAPIAVASTEAAGDKDCPAVPPQVVHSEGDTRLWQALSAIFALLWLLTAFAFWRAIRARKVPTASPAHSNAGSFNEPATFKQLEQACQSQDLTAIRKSFIHWTQAVYQDERLVTTQQCQRKHGSDALNEFMVQLDTALFSGESGQFASAELLKLLKQLRKQSSSQSSHTGDNDFNNLYPS